VRRCLTISDIKLIRTDTILNLSRKAEKGMSCIGCPRVVLLPPLRCNSSPLAVRYKTKIGLDYKYSYHHCWGDQDAKKLIRALWDLMAHGREETYEKAQQSPIVAFVALFCDVSLPNTTCDSVVGSAACTRPMDRRPRRPPRRHQGTRPDRPRCNPPLMRAAHKLEQAWPPGN